MGCLDNDLVLVLFNSELAVFHDLDLSSGGLGQDGVGVETLDNGLRVGENDSGNLVVLSLSDSHEVGVRGLNCSLQLMSLGVSGG